MELIIFISIALASLIVLLFSAHYLIIAISGYSRKTGLSDYLIGFFIISIGTALPELSTALVSSMFGKGQLSIGDVIGSNTLDLTLVLGAILLVAGTIKVRNKNIKETIITIFLMASLPLLLGIDGVLSRVDGLILLVAFLIYATSILTREVSSVKLKKDVKLKFLLKDMSIFILALIALLLSTRWLVWSTLQLSSQFSIPIFLIGSVFLATATILPELTVGIKSVIKKKQDLIFGDTFGSVVVNSTLVVGIAALINPIPLQLSGFVISSIFMLLCVALGYLMIRKKELNWKHGLLFISLYVLFILIQVAIG